MYISQAHLDFRHVFLTLFVTYVSLELTFYLFECLRFARICRSPNVATNSRRMELAMQQFSSLAGIIDIEEFLEGWFLGSKVSQIYRGNMVEFIAYGFYSKKMEHLSTQERKQIEAFLSKTSEDYGVFFPEGYNSKVKFMGHTIEPIRAFHKPLIVYLLMEMIGMCSMIILYLQGFRRIQTKGVAKWIRRPQTCDNKKGPVIFLHGVGFGVLPYFHFISSLLSLDESRAFILVEMRHVAMRLCPDDAPDLMSLAIDIVDTMEDMGYARGTFIAHSYGSFVLSQILQSRNSSVEKVCLIDPVSLMTCHPKLTSNFVYRSFQGLSLSSKRFMDLIQFVFSRDLTLAQTFCRRFNGMEVMIWPDDLPKHAKNIIVLSGKDPLIPTSLVREQFKEVNHAKVVVNDHHTHGQFLYDFKYLNYLVHHVFKKHLNE